MYLKDKNLDIKMKINRNGSYQNNILVFIVKWWL